MAQVIPIGEPDNDGERVAIAALRDLLPGDYRILHSFELRGEGGQWFQIDVAVVAPHAIYLVDVKGTAGEIHVAGSRWHPEGRAPFASPLAKLRHHTRLLHGLLSAAASGPHAALRHVWVEAAVLFCRADSSLRDPEGRDGPHVCALRDISRFFTDTARLPQRGHPPASTGPHLAHILSTLTGKARAPKNRLPLFANTWQCEERLTANDFYVEYRARDAHVPGTAPVTVRVYPADPYLPSSERDARRERIANAYTALKRMPAHPAIPPALGFFPTEGADGWVLVLGEAPGSSLRVHLNKPALRPTVDEKNSLTRGLLSALAHCHAHGVLHRAISPATVVVGPGGAARLVDFDFARPGSGPRDKTLPSEEFTVLDQSCVAPEVFADVHAGSTAASDVYGAGATFYELWTGRSAFRDPDEADARGCIFPEKPSALAPGLPEGFDAWLQQLCGKAPEERPTAAAALVQFEALFAPNPTEPLPPPTEEPPLDYVNLPVGHLLKNRYLVEGPLGKRGGFARVYRVIDTLGDVTRALKIVTSDSSSTLDRMKQEYRVVTNLPEHPGVVRVHFADLLDGPNGLPFLLMEYVEGASVAELIRDKKLSVTEAHRLAIQAAEALAHCHANMVAHGDIKPDNLMWTGRGQVKIIDFNVAVKAGDRWARGGGTRRYLPPDLDLSRSLSDEEKIERDVYALGLTLYEAATGGEYPWAGTDRPPRDLPARDPRDLPGCGDFAPAFADALRQVIAPRRAERPGSAAALGEMLRGIAELRLPPVVRTTPGAMTQGLAALAAGEHRPNTNPFVFYLQTLYSQARRTNAGTRGLDTMGRAIYVETALDRALRPATTRGEFRLVLISGNAGDGKTAFIQQLERDVRGRHLDVRPYGSGNGTEWTESGRRFRTNYDGSQDEGNKVNDDVLREFFGPFAGADASAWPTNETRVIAINEGRLIDFLEQFGAEFSRLKGIVHRGLRTGEPEDAVAVVNLNLRNVMAETAELPSIFARLLRRLVEPQFWEACETCDLRDKCYVHHNARTFANPAAGAQVTERLGLLYRLTTLRAKLHLTLRDLRSALAFTLAGTRDCDEIHALHARGDREEWAQGFYFNAWAGHETGEGDRLLRLLGEVDIGRSSDPKLDRAFDFHPPDPAPELLDFENRGRYDRDLLSAIYGELPSEVTSRLNGVRFARHRKYVATMRRRHFFESRDESWRRLVPYGAATAMMHALSERRDPQAAALDVIRAMNRGEGIFDTRRLRGKLALQVRQVEAATVRSYRVFDAADFTLVPQEPAQASPYLEHAPTALRLLYRDGSEGGAELVITLDVWEMLERLNQGFRPTPDEAQGYGLALAVFKNILGSAPYQEVLLTPSGHDFYAVSRAPSGELTLRVAEEPENEYGAR